MRRGQFVSRSRGSSPNNRLDGSSKPGPTTRSRKRDRTQLDNLEALIRFDAPKEGYLAFVQARGLTPFVVSGPNVHLLTDWQPPPKIEKPAWWDPSSETPPDAASGKVGIYGSIVVKWEEGRVYALIVDTGHRSSASGPQA
jgi:hypothetical protein